jgi:hypothetical protein
MDVGSVLLGFALLLGVAVYVARPLIEKRGLNAKEFSAADALLAQRETVLNALRDLDFDHATGKITDDDYAPQRERLLAQGVAVLKQLESLGVAVTGNGAAADDSIEQAVRARRKPAAASTGNVEDDAIEAAVASRRRAAAVTCPQCGASARPADRFCPQCGAPLTLACPDCGRPALPGDKFCAGCGAALQTASVS